MTKIKINNIVKFNQEVKLVKEFNNNQLTGYVAREIAKISQHQEAVAVEVKKVVKAKKETKTEMALRVAKERNITTHAEASNLMRELGISSGAVYNVLKKELSLGISKTQIKKQEQKSLNADVWQISKEDILELINSGDDDRLCWAIWNARRNRMNGVNWKPLYARKYGN
jgi:hypothetical protein